MEELDFEQKLDFQNGKKLDFEQILLQIMQFYTKNWMKTWYNSIKIHISVTKEL